MTSDNLINVLSYHTSPVGIKTKHMEHILPASDGITPSVIPLTLADIQFIATDSNHFKTGILTFENDEKAKYYEMIRILDWKNILTDEDIRNIILKPTTEGMERIVSIKDGQLFERVRGALVFLENSGADIITKTKDVINKRYIEIRNGKINNSQIILRSTKEPEKINNSEVEELKTQLANMQKMMAEFMANSNKPTDSNDCEKISETNEDPKQEVKPVPKKPGRTPSKK